MIDFLPHELSIREYLIFSSNFYYTGIGKMIVYICFFNYTCKEQNEEVRLVLN